MNEKIPNPKSQGETILVTGGAGYVGSVTAEFLIQKGYDVVIVDIARGTRLKLLPKAKVFIGDFGNVNLLTEIFDREQIDAVFHFAAEASIEDSMRDPSSAFKTNVAKGITLLDTMRQFGCDRFIFSSTAAIFGEPKYTPIDEAHPTEPINAYGESKLMFEKVLDWYHRAYGLKFMAFRYFNVAGASPRLGDDSKRHLIPIVLDAARGKRDLMVYGTDYETSDGTCVRDYVHVLDVAFAHLLGLEKLDEFPCGKYNLGSGEGFSVLQVIEEVERGTGKHVPVKFAPRRLGDPAVLVADSEKLQHQLGWSPEFSRLKVIIQTAWLHQEAS